MFSVKAAIPFDILQNKLFDTKQVSLSVLRLDKIHPVVSGNKLFKLHYFFEEQNFNHFEQAITFGGAFSNHLVATAFFCKANNIACSGIVRGEQPPVYSHTLQQCVEYGMKLYFVRREVYKKKDEVDFIKNTIPNCDSYIKIPEGGYHPLGAKGAALIMDNINDSNTHICTAIGTATTLAGLALGANDQQVVIGIPVLKGMKDIQQRIDYLTNGNNIQQKLKIIDDYHFGGYAKSNNQLFSFMNELYKQHSLPTDFVYTGKMLFAIFDLIKNDFFEKGSKIVCVHTGGLQGNQSLPEGTLTF